jgi:hypothetical protein
MLAGIGKASELFSLEWSMRRCPLVRIKYSGQRLLIQPANEGALPSACTTGYERKWKSITYEALNRTILRQYLDLFT